MVWQIIMLMQSIKDKRGNLYFGTDGGLNILSNGKMKTITSKDGLSDNTILGILEDDLGRIYLSTNRGVNILETKNDSIYIRTLRYSDGLASDECNQGAVYKDNFGKLWFGTSKGASCYDPSKDLPNNIPPVVHITRIRVFENNIPKSKTEFKYNENYLKFDFIGISLPTTEKVIYQYKLSGIDKDWVETKQRFVQYTNLDDGDYQFQVKAKNEWGYWSKPVMYSFIISPPFWETWWFRLILILAVISLLWYSYNLRVQKLLAVERMRLRIASDLHDDIGATLTHISVNSEMIKHNKDVNKIKESANKIGKLSREVIQTMSDIVWSIDSRNDSIQDLVTRMTDLAHQLLSPKEIKFKITS